METPHAVTGEHVNMYLNKGKKKKKAMGQRPLPSPGPSSSHFLATVPIKQGNKVSYKTTASPSYIKGRQS